MEGTDMVAITVDDNPVSVADGATLLDALRSAHVATPTLCFGETLTPVNACRVCVVELEGSRTLVPSCSRKADRECAAKLRTIREGGGWRMADGDLTSAVCGRR